MSNVLSEKTLIPISLVITIIGGVVWLTTLWFRTEAQAQNIAEVKAEQKSLVREVQDNNKEVMKKLIELEVKLGVR